MSTYSYTFKWQLLNCSFSQKSDLRNYTTEVMDVNWKNSAFKTPSYQNYKERDITPPFPAN